MRDQTLARLIEDMPDDEVRAARHDAAVGLSLLRPGSLMYAPAHAYLGLLDAELVRRTTPGSRPAPAPDPIAPAPRRDPDRSPPGTG
ncbi:MAG: hypothetical protein ACRDOL_16765 [Streptosporangiaceae bacterium]